MRWPTCSWPAERPTDEGPPAGGRDGSEMPVAPGRADGPGVESTSGPATSTDEEGTRSRVKRELIPAVLHLFLLGGGFRHQRVAGRGDVPAVPRRPVQRGPGLARILRRLPARQPGRLPPGPPGAGAGLRRPRPRGAGPCARHAVARHAVARPRPPAPRGAPPPPPPPRPPAPPPPATAATGAQGSATQPSPDAAPAAPAPSSRATTVEERTEDTVVHRAAERTAQQQPAAPA